LIFFFQTCLMLRPGKGSMAPTPGTDLSEAPIAWHLRLAPTYQRLLSPGTDAWHRLISGSNRLAPTPGPDAKAAWWLLSPGTDAWQRLISGSLAWHLSADPSHGTTAAWHRRLACRDHDTTNPTLDQPTHATKHLAQWLYVAARSLGCRWL